VKILILGGYGVFGGRLAELLSDLSQVQLVIAGRSLTKAEAFCSGYQGEAGVEPLGLDRAELVQRLCQIAPDLVVDASGPFQGYGPDPYLVVRACIAERVPYMDFADAADFVFGVSQFDAEAKAAGIFVLSGVSSFPVLTAAVLRVLGGDMQITHVTGGIAPSPYAGIGLNVMRAVVSYAGRPVTLAKDGAQAMAPGLVSSIRYTVAAPGALPLRNTHFSLVDVPDLQVLPPEHPQLQEIWMGAGPVPEVLHRMLNVLARARAAFRLPSLEPLSPLFYRVLNLMRFGEHRGGMFVHVRGVRDGADVERSWHMLAEGDDGPYIPSMAIEALVRKMLLGDRPEAGARPATHALEVADYEALFAGRAITAGVREADDAGAPLYRRILGRAFDELPAPIRDLHELDRRAEWRGQAEVRRGSNRFARLLARMFSFPKAGREVPLTVRFEAKDGVERWERDFDGTRFHSLQSAGSGRNAHLMVERFGPISVALALVVSDGRLSLVPRRWAFFGVPMPRWLLPAGASFEHADDGRFHFDVEMRVPLIGLIAGYRGHLARHDA